MLIDFRKNPPPVPYLEIGDKIVERVDEYKYMGIFIDNSLAFNIDNSLAFLMQELYERRALKKARQIFKW